VLLVALISILLFSSQAAAACENVEVCRAEALIAHAKGDFESFHDYAWAAYRKAKPNDPELMLLIARAQSLSGRPGDALVMLERVAAQGKLPSDVATDPEFARVRTLSRWAEVSDALLGAARTGAADGTPPAASAPAAPPKPDATKTEPASPKPSKPAPAEPAKPEPAKPEPARSEPSKPAPPKPESKRPAPKEVVTPSKADPAEKPPVKPEPPRASAEVPRAPAATEKAAAPGPPVAPRRTPGAPLKFETPLTPTALAYDRVSKRYIIGDRRARRIAVIDENTGHVSTLVGAMGGLGDVEGIAIDAKQGDLWVLTSSDQEVSLSKMQLISGRVLSTVKVPDLRARVVALSFVPGAGLVAADAEGILWALRPGGRVEKLAALEYVPAALGADTRGRLYVSAGGPRLARFAMSPFRKIGTVELETGPAPVGAFVLVEDRLESIVIVEDGFEPRGPAVK
jgi:hypothetical protein